MDEFERGLTEAKSKLESFGKSASGISDGLSKAYSGIGDALKPAVDGFKAVEGVGKQAGNAVMGGLKGFAAASTAVAGFGTAAVKSGMQFDATMSEVSAISGATGADFDSLRNKALEMGAKTKFSASEAAEAMTYMGMAGWKAGDMISGIEGIMNLAAASGEDLATTSDIVTDALTAFGLQASDSGHFANVMAVAATNANTNVGMMGETFKYVAPVAGALGYSVDDTALAIGLMANSGIKATQAGTALRSIFSRLSTDAGASSKKLGALGVLTEELGVQFYNTDGSARDLNDVLIDSRAAWAGLSEEQQITYAKTIAGQEAMSGWLALMNASPADVEKLTNALNDCNGAAEKMAATMVDNLQGDLTLLGSAFESLQIAISDSLTPTLREFAQFGQKAMAQLLEGFQGGGVSGFMSALSGIVTQGVTMLAQKAPEFAKVSLQFVTALGDGLLNAGNEINTAFGRVMSTLISGAGEWVSTNSDRLLDIGYGLVTNITAAFLNASDIISDNIGKFVPLIVDAFTTYHDVLFGVGINILGAIGQGIVENKDKIQRYISTMIRNMVIALQENAPAIIEGGLALLEALVGAIEENLPLILATGGEIVARLIAGISTASPGVQAIIGTAILPHILKIVDVVGKIGGAFNGVAKLVKDGLGGILGAGGKLLGGITKLWGLLTANPIVRVIALVAALAAGFIALWNNCEEFRNFWIGLWDGLKEVAGNFVNWFKNMWNGIGEFFSNLWEGVKETFSALGEWIAEKAAEIVEFFKEAWNGLIEFFGELWEGIKEVFSGVAEFFGEVFAAAVEAISTAWTAVVEFFQGVWQAIQGVFSTAAEVLGGLFQAAAEAVQAAWNAVVEFFSGVWQGIQEIFASVAEVLGGFFQTAAEAVKNAWSAIVEFFQGIWEGIKNVFSVVAEVLGGFFRAAVDAIKAVWEGISEFFQGVWQSIQDVFSTVAEVLGGFFQAAADAVQAAWETVVSFFEDIWNGITSSVEEVKDKIESAFQEARNRVEKVWDGIKGFFENTVIKNITSAFNGIKSKFATIGNNIVSGLKNGIKEKWENLKSFVGEKVNGLVSFVMGLLGEHSPSKVFAGIGGNMALGLKVGWSDEYGEIKKEIEKGLNFGTASIGLSGNYSGTRYGANGDAVSAANVPTGTTVNIYSPVAVDPVQAAREWKKTTQRMAIGYV